MSEEGDCGILDRSADPSAPLPFPPNGLCRLALLEIVVRDRDRDALLLEVPSYEPPNNATPYPCATGFWSAPYISYPIDLPAKAPATVGELRALFAGATRAGDDRMIEDISTLAFTSGVQHFHLVKREGFIEYKRMATMENLFLYVDVQRFTVAGTHDDVVSIADPEFAKAHVFIPIDEATRAPMVRTHDCPVHRRRETLFLSRPLHTNVDHILRNETASLRAEVMKIKRETFSHEEPALLLCFDLAGYGLIQQSVLTDPARDTMGRRTGSTEFRQMVLEEMQELTTQVGIRQSQLAGDGFLAAMPESHFADIGLPEAFARFMVAYAAMLERLAAVAKGMPGVSIGSRLAVHHGRYRYGRIGGVRAVGASYEGENIIATARLEQALRSLVKGEQLGVPVERTAHTLVFSSFVPNPVKVQFNRSPGNFELLGDRSFGQKEFDGRGTIYLASKP